MHELLSQNRSHQNVTHGTHTIRSQGLDHKQLMNSLTDVSCKKRKNKLLQPKTFQLSGTKNRLFAVGSVFIENVSAFSPSLIRSVSLASIIMMHAQHVPTTEFPCASFYLSATRENFESCTCTGDVNRFATV